MRDGLFFIAILVILVITFAGTIIHSNQHEYDLQVKCMNARGNWETREGRSDWKAENGCRFPSVEKKER